MMWLIGIPTRMSLDPLLQDQWSLQGDILKSWENNLGINPEFKALYINSGTSHSDHFIHMLAFQLSFAGHRRVGRNSVFLVLQICWQVLFARKEMLIFFTLGFAYPYSYIQTAESGGQHDDGNATLCELQRKQMFQCFSMNIFLKSSVVSSHDLTQRK